MSCAIPQRHADDCGNSPQVREGVDPQVFPIHLCRKNSQFGEFDIPQFWMPKPGLYADRGRTAKNHGPILDAYWAICTAEGKNASANVRSTYLLARLLPLTRSNGSRRVFQDAALRRPGVTQSRDAEEVEELKNLLERAAQSQMDPMDFYTRTANLLGPPEYPQEVWDRYLELEDSLLDDVGESQEAGEPPSIEAVVAVWKTQLRRFGRHTGHELKKQVLDVFSYEARAAFHSCYSAVWCYLFDSFSGPTICDRNACCFIIYGTLISGRRRTRPRKPTSTSFMAISLHPSGVRGICGHPYRPTTFGRVVELPRSLDCSQRLLGQPANEPELIQELLGRLPAQPCFHLFVHGMLVATCHYAERYDQARLLPARLRGLMG